LKALLLTGTILPFVAVKHNDPRIRLIEYTETIENYLRNSDFDSIVFAENSGYPFSAESDEFSALAKALGKQFEYLYLDHDQTQYCNMSVSEALLMKKALQYSKLLQSADYIWKCTGRVYVKNSNRITRDTTESCFLYSRQYNSIQTWFFGVRRDDFLRLLSPEVIKDMSNDCIEYAWMRYYSSHRDTLRFGRFARYPDAQGINSIGKPYSSSLFKKFCRNLLLLLGKFDVK